MIGDPDARQPRSGLVVPAILAAVGFVVLIGLGTWQIERKAWKEALIDTLNQRLAAAPSELPPRSRWSELSADADEFRRVRFAAAFLPKEEALVYANGSLLRPDVTEPGYWVLAPAQLSGGGVVVVDRGYVPEGRQDPATRTAGEIAGPAEMIGVMRWPEEARWFTPAADARHNLWFVRDQLAIAAAKHWGEVAPFLVALESPSPPGGLPRPGPLQVNLPNDHLQYALTWYGLAAGLAGVFAFWLRARRRESDAT